MQIYQSTLHYTLVQLGATDALTKPLTYVEYMQGAFEDCACEESLWLISMNPKCRPIARTLIRTGPLVAAMTSPRDLFRVALHADANAIAVVRGEPGERVNLTNHDLHALQRFRDTAAGLNIQFVDYLVVAACDGLRCPSFCSWRATIRPAWSPSRSPPLAQPRPKPRPFAALVRRRGCCFARLACIIRAFLVPIPSHGISDAIPRPVLSPLNSTISNPVVRPAGILPVSNGREEGDRFSVEG